MNTRNPQSIQVLSAASRVAARRLADYISHRSPMPTLLFFLVEAVGVTLFGSGALSTLAFLAAETPAEAARRSFARMPTECEAGFLNHGAYTCWYTISAHPLLFALSITAVFAGVATMVWAQRRWSRLRCSNEA
jgi:hypothetical protein